MAIYGNFSRKNTAAQIAAGTINASAKTITVNQQTYPDGTIFFGSDGTIYFFNGTALVKAADTANDIREQMHVMASMQYVAEQVARKQDALTEAQLNAVNSGISGSKVGVYDGYASQINGKEPTLTGAKLNAVNSGITSAKVTTYDGYAGQIAGKQATLSSAQLNAANSGITSAKVTTYDGYASQISGKAAASDLTALVSRVAALESLLNIDK